MTEDRQAEELLIEVLNKGLLAYAPRLELHGTMTSLMKRFGAANQDTNQQWSIGTPNVDLFDGVCLQLFNLLAEGLPASRCKNDVCDKWFVRQRGRAKSGQHRTTGVTYCSTSCARSHTQRTRRQRVRAEERQAETASE